MKSILNQGRYGSAAAENKKQPRINDVEDTFLKTFRGFKNVFQEEMFSAELFGQISRAVVNWYMQGSLHIG